MTDDDEPRDDDTGETQAERDACFAATDSLAGAPVPAVDPSRSYPDGTKALTPLSSLSLETLARLARAVEAGPWHTADALWRPPVVSRPAARFIAACTPERILGLIAAARQGADDAARLDWIDKRVGRDEGLIVQAWNHDGRRFIPRDRDGWPCLLVHKFAARGGADEGVREAIDAVTHSAAPEERDDATAQQEG